jgi:uncharacterized protein
MLSALRGPWPWYVSGPLIGLLVPALLLIGNKSLGVSSSLRAICAAVAPGKVSFFAYDWRRQGAWNVAFVLGILLGAVLAAVLLGVTTPAISPNVQHAVAALGLGSTPTGLAPSTLFSWSALATWRGLVAMVGGGFLVGFGASYAGGCTSGHGITGLAALQLASLVAIVGIFAGGILATFVLFPIIF